MIRDEIEKKVLEIVSDMTGVSAETITLETNPAEDLGADSLDAVEIVMTVEDEFDVSVPDEDAEKWKTVKDIVDWVEKNTQ
jgi:acyl carrier protein